MFAEVILSKATPMLDRIYHYRVPDELKDKITVGHQISMPFGNRIAVGYVVGFVDKPDVAASLVKDIISIKSEVPLFQPEALKLAKWMVEYYGCFFISALRTIMPPGTGGKEERKTKAKIAPATESQPANLEFRPSPFTLTAHQKEAVDKIIASLDGDKKTVLLYGITGSGKTEVYLRSIEYALNKGQSSIVLVPEISLTPQLVGRFRERFQDHIATLHSDLTLKKRDEEWTRIAKGEAKIILGTRSAVFAPAKNLGLVILDEEFEQSYKQEKNPRYHAREVAQQLGATVVLGSATPSIETYYKAETGDYKLASLPERIEKRPLPPIEIIDMKKEPERLLSARLRQEIAETLARGEKAILFINRRGFFTYVVCKSCGSPVECKRCSVSLVYHADDKKLRCGHCEFETEANMVCPKCHNASLSFVGIGTQRIEKEVAEVYRDAKIIRYDRDSVLKKGSHETIFAAFAEGDANVLIGTQMVTKGLDVPKVTLVGVVSADTTLNLPDFRSAERTFQQITQVAGRAGRHHLPGKVVVQTMNPDHYALKHALTHDYDGFYKEEIEFRRALFYPPFSRLINIVISGRNEFNVMRAGNYLADILKRALPKNEKTAVLGPAKAPLSKLRGAFRYQILIKTDEGDQVRGLTVKTIKEEHLPMDIRVAVDIDPISLL